MADGLSSTLCLVQMEVANATANAIEARHRTRWQRGNSCEVICTYNRLNSY